jgi:hypothetical protein
MHRQFLCQCRATMPMGKVPKRLPLACISRREIVNGTFLKDNSNGSEKHDFSSTLELVISQSLSLMLQVSAWTATTARSGGPSTSTPTWKAGKKNRRRRRPGGPAQPHTAS